MTDIRREKLRGLKPPGSHAGLALSQMLNTHEKPGPKETHPYTALIGAVAGWEVPPIYAKVFERWKCALEGAVFIEATTLGPLAIGLGNASPLENGLSIHHTYGTPYLPGSALKGLMRRAADRHGLSDADKSVLFGTTDSASYLVYWDGWLDPASKNPFQPDVITVHHQGYYGSGGKVWPTDFDDPNPVSFLSVSPGTKFCIALSSPSSDSEGWVFAAAEILEWGLENLGLGGKTNAGYGYFGDFKRTVPERPKSQSELADELRIQTQEVLSQAKDAQSLSKIDDYLPRLEVLEPAVRRPSLEVIKRHLTAMTRWDLAKSRCQKVQSLLEES